MIKKSSKSTLTNEEALDYILKASKKFLPNTEVIPLTVAYSRILAEDIVSDINIPGADTSSRDGFCLKASSVTNCNHDNPIELKLVKNEVHAGHCVESI